MKAYGLPRNDDVANPDKADIKLYGLSTPDRCSRADRGKNSSRRLWKKKARNAMIAQIRDELGESK
jgi:hypothetical protein